MHLDPILPKLVGVILVMLVLGGFLRLIKQPYAIGYLVAGVLLGPHGLGMIDDEAATQRLGAFGVVILLFFVGMEVSLPRLAERWRVALIGTLLQILGSVAFVGALGYFLEWPLSRVLLLGFVISLSSTAIVIKLLQDWGELDSKVGQDVVAILLAQDLAIVPMLLTLQIMGGEEIGPGALALQIVGGLAFVACLGWLVVKKEIRLPLGNAIREDHELQVFAALIFCFGLALLTGLLGLSTALGAFLAGVLLSTARETKWVTERLESFRVVFVALFFVSVGMLIDLEFVRQNAKVLALLLVGVLLTNTFLNASILRALGDRWRGGLYGGALLSQIGEFSFVLAAVGLQAQFVSTYAYQATVATIALTLVVSPFWIALVRRLTREPGPPEGGPPEPSPPPPSEPSSS